MVEMPKEIRTTFEALKKAYGSYIEVKHLNKRFCVFEATSVWDPDLQKPRKITNYLGWIDENGLMVPAHHKEIIKNKKEVNTYRRIEKEQSKEEEIQRIERIDENDKKILLALSMNARMSYNKMQRILKIPIRNIEYRIKRLERLFDIRYTEEVDMTNLGFAKYIIFVKFTEKIPSAEALKTALCLNLRVQLAMLTKGEYDLIFYCVAETDSVLSNSLYNIRGSEGISNAKAFWYVSPMEDDYNFIPLRDSFFDVLKEKVWHRKKNGPKPARNDIMQRDYAVLKELNNNSRISFAEIDRIYNMPRGSAKNAYERLSGDETNILVRPTITMRKLNFKYNGVIISDIIDMAAFIKTRDLHHKYVIAEPDAMTNRFTYMGDIENPDGVMYLAPIFKDGDLETIMKDLANTVEGIELHSLMVSNVIVGNLCYRRFDNLYSSQYLSLVKRKSIESKERINYKA
ncbi:MAG: winged helix-turn-helix transcriptional regulator [Candidatus Marsarchaeota archaeon]|nr:winged helix-turn-helix transcriptional regulator [Candidatus Marsarchaeota archaeon]